MIAEEVDILNDDTNSGGIIHQNNSNNQMAAIRGLNKTPLSRVQHHN